jgi:TFIIF-interacting CTD phosphatase-like protein
MFTNHQPAYVDPILNKLDPGLKFFQNRFYGESCLNDKHGQIIKDMSVVQSLIEEPRAQKSRISTFIENAMAKMGR